ncbi:MAG TPA: glycosyltransferase [Acidimicrobiales bacterium]|nr:glycosyltransferase [Acidimicrobiales bacterium]
MMPDLSLVLPAFNEESRLLPTLATLAEFAAREGLATEVIVSDDGSSDRTVVVAREWAAANSTPSFAVRVVSGAHRGKGAAVRAGMTEVTADVVGYCDADLSAGVEAIARLHRAVLAGADLALASRGLAESVLEVRQPWYRERAGRVFNFTLRHLAEIPYRDTQCGLKLFRRDAARQVFRYQRLDGFAFDAELVVLAVRLGLRIEEVPVRWAHSRESKLSFMRDSVQMSGDIVRIVRRLRRGAVRLPGVPDDDAIDRMAASEAGHWWYVAKRRLVADSLRSLGCSGRCLDVGCGGGATLAEMEGSMSAFGADVSELALSHAHSRWVERLVKADGGLLPFADGAFDAVLALDVIEHTSRPELILQECRRVLAPGGVLVVTVPAFQWMWSYADHVLGHYRRYTRDQLACEMESAGYVLLRTSYFHSWLLPVAWLFRKARALLGRTESADDFMVAGPVNTFLSKVCDLERRLLARRDLPFGLSVLGLARASGRSSLDGWEPAASERRFTSPGEGGRAPATQLLAPSAR